ncbi:hypothetical protein DWW90_05890 [Parabacteroides sp. AF17-28]|nr:hypothetical protein DWW90_05890 [Parabacteroides sp. AF17-28]
MVVFCPENGPLFNYDRTNLNYDRLNLCGLPSALPIETVIMAKRTVAMAKNSRKRGKSPFLRLKNMINICLLSGAFWGFEKKFCTIRSLEN